MKKKYFFTLFFSTFFTVFAQTKSTGIIALTTGMTAEISLDSNTSLVTLTMTGPSNAWFSIGFGGSNMNGVKDCVVMKSATQFTEYTMDRYSVPTEDSTNKWNLRSNTVSGTTRTIVATRAMASVAPDYTFNINATSINLIWAKGNNFSFTGHSAKGTKTGTFTTLGLEDFATLDKLNVYPNPSKGVFTIFKSNEITIKKIKVLDTNAKLLKEIAIENDFENLNVDVSNFSKGIYFLELSNDTDKTVKKISIE